MGKKIRQLKKLEASLQSKRFPGTHTVLQAITKEPTNEVQNNVMDLSFLEEDSVSSVSS